MDEAKKFVPSEHFMKLKGKDYLQVMWRLVWFREDHPDWNISTRMEFFDSEGKQAIFRAEISNGEKLLSSGYGSETAKDFADYIEKAETKAIGRALAILGYGTQFAPEMEEGDDEEHQRLADSPVERKKKPEPKVRQAPQDVRTQHKVCCSDCGKEIIDVKFAGGNIMKAEEIISRSVNLYQRPLCIGCAKKANNAN